MNAAVNRGNLQNSFEHSSRPHIFMITNHGMHNWTIIPGLPDTGGQNVFVNQLSQTLANNGYKVTVFNRGGYPHPSTGELRQGIHFRDGNQRLVFLTDRCDTFTPKEQMGPQIPLLAEALLQFTATDRASPGLIISHYWDGAEIARLAAASMDPRPLHLWIPHSLGRIKKQNVSPEEWPQLAIQERIDFEDRICSEVDAVISTSSLIRQSLDSGYHVDKPILDLPPCIDTNRFHPMDVSETDPIWSFISSHCNLSADEVRSRKIITEISRTDTTKRKDVLIRAFVQLHNSYPEAFLMTSFDANTEIGVELHKMILDSGKSEHIVILSNVYKQLPALYAVSSMYCTPSIMEGFGMSAQEAAATGIPVIASDRVPFAVEELLGSQIQEVVFNTDSQPYLLGEGGIVVPADHSDGFTAAMATLLNNEQLRSRMGKNAYAKTIPAFAWDVRIESFLLQVHELQSSLT